MLNLEPSHVRSSPYPYLVVDDILGPELFAALRAAYPAIERSTVWNRMSADLVIGDDRFTELVAGGPWKILHGYFSSPQFLDEMRSLFGKHLEAGELRVELDALRLGQHVETREWIAGTIVSKAVADYEGDRTEVFVRMDLGVGDVGYKRGTHLDWRHRIFSLLIYFDDAGELAMEGGNFLIEELSEGTVTVVDTIAPRRNMGILKVDNNRSYHSVDEITRANGLRRTLYVAVSSRGSVW